MDIFDSFVTWLKDVFKPLIDLYNEDSTTFFVGAIFVVLILLIIVIVLARRAEDDEKKSSKKIKYEDIDWSVPGEESTPARTEAAAIADPSAKPADLYEAAVNKRYGVGEVDIDKNTFGHEGLSPEVTEALMKSIKVNTSDISVPMWMTKQTMSLDDIELQDAQEWVEQQLQEKEARAHDRQVEKATVERIAEILEKIDLCDKAKEDYKKRQAELEKENPPAEGEKIDLDEIAPLVQERKPEPETEPEQEAPETDETYEVPAGPAEETIEEVNDAQAQGLHDSDTLAKIMREAEEIRAEGYGGEPEETGPGDSADEGPEWGIAATLARLEAMQSENDNLLKELEKDADLPSDYHEKKKNTDAFENEADQIPDIGGLKSGAAVLSEEEEVPAENEAAYRLEPQLRRSKKGTHRRFGLNNRDTNRSGRKFTEEELMKQIRD